MRIGILLKGIPFESPRVRFRIREDGSGLDLEDAKWAANPFDMDAVEWGVWLRGRTGGEVVILTCGPVAMDRAIRSGLAGRADRAIRVALEDPDELQPLAIAKILAAVIVQEGFEIVFAGKEALDTNGNQLPQIVAELLGWPHATNATELEPRPDGDQITVHRMLQRGKVEVVELELPAVISVESPPKGFPYASLKDVMFGKKKTISVIPPPYMAGCVVGSQSPAVMMSRRVRTRCSKP